MSSTRQKAIALAKFTPSPVAEINVRNPETGKLDKRVMNRTDRRRFLKRVK